MPNDTLPHALVVGLSAGLAALVSAALIHFTLPLLERYALARPNARSSHTAPTPQGAGTAVIAATLLISSGFLLSSAGAFAATAPLLAATLFIAALGAFDDITPLSVMPRLLAQTAAVAVTLWALPEAVRIAPFLPFWAERALLLVGTLWFVNLVNFMDGLDWMTVAETVPVTAALVALGLSGALSWPSTIVVAGLAGACLGFAPYNKPVARVFLGDVGSLPIGLLLAWCLIELAAQSWAAALLLPLYYLMDATLTLLRRLLKREAVWQAHRSHFYQRATTNGFTVMQVVGRIFVLNLALAALAIGAIWNRSAIVQVELLTLGVVATAILLMRFSRLRA
jgi:UDP-N-acetylmuramyl pentapeptide phosphotransferase/UDP-N-acetylglucosamine-1-phosphate transferase